MSKTNTWRSASAIVAIAAASCFSATGRADETIRTGDGLLSLTANMPEEIRAGEEFTYSVKVTNASDNVTLHDIKLKQLKAKGFSVDSMSSASKQSDSKGESDSKGQSKSKGESDSKGQSKSKGQSDSQDQSKSKSQSASESQSKSKSQSASESQSESKGDDKSKGQSESKGGDNANGNITIAVLKPGESKTINVTASADEEGELRSCLAIVNYMPAICLTSRVIKPELELTKTAPKEANRCDVIKLEYTFKNGGSGDVGAFVVTDSLGKGLATIDGDSTLKFDVDGLAAGDSRTFIAKVYASKPGSFSSRAVAKAENSDLKSRSKETTTDVIAADLDVQVQGPNRLYGEKLAKFTAHVTNTGNTTADDVNVNVYWPEACDLVDLSTPKMQSSNSTSSQSNQKKQGEPTVAKNAGGAGDSSSAKKNDKADVAMSDKSLSIGRLEAGQTAVFEYAIRTRDVKTLPTKVVARYVCDVDAAEDQANAKSETVATAMARVEIVRLPALQLVVLDDQDPVNKNSNVVYTIRVWNEGDAADSNVAVSAELPEGLKFVRAEGPTENSVDGSKITFEPVKTMKPGDRADYKVTAKCTGSGDVRFSATLSSKSLKKEVTGEEPTRLFDQSAN